MFNISNFSFRTLMGRSTDTSSALKNLKPLGKQATPKTSYTDEEILDRMNTDPMMQLNLVTDLLNGNFTDQREIDQLKKCTPCIDQNDQEQFINEHHEHEWKIIEAANKGQSFILRFFIEKLDMFSYANLQFLITSVIRDEEFDSELILQTIRTVMAKKSYLSDHSKIPQELDSSTHSEDEGPRSYREKGVLSRVSW